MPTQRIKSIDIFRGLCMAWMILTHIIDWWLNIKYDWLHRATIMIVDPIGASGFLFISGVSIMISYKNRFDKIKVSDNYNYRIVKNSYLFRAFFILITALIYNSVIAISRLNPSMIWTWFILQTIAISMLITWPLLKLKKLYRILIGCFVLILNQILFTLLIPFEGEYNLLGVLFHFLYFNKTQDPILVFYPFFLFGTVIGEILYDVYYKDNNQNIKSVFKTKLLSPLILIGNLLILFGILFQFPKFLLRESFSWIIYSLGIELIIFSILLYFEICEIIKSKKSYKFLFYYSYYSLTIYLAHNLLYFLFLNQLNVITIWIFASAAFLIIGIILRALYKIFKDKVSLKVQIGRLSLAVTEKIERRRAKKFNLKNL
jgi:uncharacterized membrane protein